MMKQLTQICVYELDNGMFKVKIGHGGQVVDSDEHDSPDKAMQVAADLLGDGVDLFPPLEVDTGEA